LKVTLKLTLLNLVCRINPFHTVNVELATVVAAQAFYEGFIDGMNRYRTEIDMKVGIDRTQMTYHCCGALSYEDWFQIYWVDVEYLDKFDSEVSKYAG